jgi:hypothetical protein
MEILKTRVYVFKGIFETLFLISFPKGITVANHHRVYHLICFYIFFLEIKFHLESKSLP